MNRKQHVFAAALIASIFIGEAGFADNNLFGGYPERFKGKGDRIPPDCQVTYPAVAADPFFILWNCVDNAAPHEDLRSELWIKRTNDSAWELIKTFLGFPASIQVTPELLRAETVKEGLPANFRLVGVDKAGNVAISKSFSVSPGDSGALSCDIQVITEETETSSDGTTTGEPSQSVILSLVSTSVTSSAGTSYNLQSAQQSQAAPCEISELCQGMNGLTFSATLDINDSGEATGSLALTPEGNDGAATEIEISGSATASDGNFTEASMEGTTVIGEKNAGVTFICTSSGSSASTSTTTSTDETEVAAENVL